jgi:8-oxo-dGTP diphosphatase
MADLKVLITSAVVAAVILNEDGAVYLQKRPEGKSYAGKWELPGGKVEEGETLEEALRREIQEELRITVTPHRYLASTITKFHTSSGEPYQLHFYVCGQITHHEPEPTVAAEWAWVPRKHWKHYDLLNEDLLVLETLF